MVLDVHATNTKLGLEDTRGVTTCSIQGKQSRAPGYARDGDDGAGPWVLNLKSSPTRINMAQMYYTFYEEPKEVDSSSKGKAQ